MNKKRLSKYAIGLIILMITTQITSGYSSETIEQCSLFTQTISANNPKIYNDVKILMISRMYDSIEIDGFHNYNYGNGHDDNIALRDSNRIYIIGILVIWDDSEIKEFNLLGGWVHTRIEIFDYDGWMSGQDTLSHLKMFGNCKTIKITVYRGHSSFDGTNKKINTYQPTYSFNDVNITMLSGYVKKTSINGYHKWHRGCGDDRSIHFTSFIRPFSPVSPSNSWIKVESNSEVLLEREMVYFRDVSLVNYSGWMFGHHLHFLVVKGFCDEIDIWTFR